MFYLMNGKEEDDGVFSWDVLLHENINMDMYSRSDNFFYKSYSWRMSVKSKRNVRSSCYLIRCPTKPGAERGLRYKLSILDNSDKLILWSSPETTDPDHIGRHTFTQWTYGIKHHFPWTLYSELKSRMSWGSKLTFELKFISDIEPCLKPSTSVESKGNVAKCVSGKNLLSKDFTSLFKEDHSYDVTFTVMGSAELKAHRLILKARSPVFRTMFSLDMTERNSGKIQITDCDPAAFEDFLLFMYSGDVEITRQHVIDLYRVSDKYEVVDLTKICAVFIANDFNLKSFCDYISLALKYNETKVLERGIAFMAENLEEILGLENWQKFIEENSAQGNLLITKAVRIVRQKS